MKQAANQFTGVPGPRWAAGLAWIIGGACLGFVGAGLYLYAMNRAIPGVAEDFFPTEPVGGIAFAILGMLVVTRLPNNRVGWLFLVISLGAAIALFTDQYMIYGLVTRPGLLPAIRAVAWFHVWVWLIGNWAIGLLPLIFPNGHLLSANWRWVAWLLTVSVSGFIVLVVGITWGMTAQQLRQFTDSQFSPTLQMLEAALILAMFGSYLLAAFSLLIRLRRARGVERQQLKWFTFAVALLVLAIVLANLIQAVWPIQNLDTVSKLIQALALAGMAVAIGLAILQHRLFDIDIIIRRTLSYTLLSLTLALVYWGSVVVLENLFHGLTGQGQSPLIVVLSTLTIAALFTPLRRRVQAVIDQRFYRRQYDAEQVLADFGTTVRNETNLDQLTQELVQVVHETIQPTHSALWLYQRNSNHQEQRVLP